MTRFLRDYQLTIGVGNQAVVVVPPINITFSATKSTDVALNKLTLKVWNLRQANRLALVKDEDEDEYTPLELSVGYQGRMPLLFRGSVHKGEHQREGADFVNTIECLDGGQDALNSFTSVTVRGKDQAIRAALGDMPNTAEGAITPHTQLVRPKVLVGNSARLITDMLDDNEAMFIDDEQLFVLRNDEVRTDLAPLVTARTGLMNKPQASKGEVTFQTIMNPTLKVAGLCELASITAPSLNGVYRIKQINYSGDYTGSDWTQTVTAERAANYKEVGQ
jgi:hypothetical protein